MPSRLPALPPFSLATALLSPPAGQWRGTPARATMVAGAGRARA